MWQVRGRAGEFEGVSQAPSKPESNCRNCKQVEGERGRSAICDRDRGACFQRPVQLRLARVHFPARTGAAIFENSAVVNVSKLADRTQPKGENEHAFSTRPTYRVSGMH